MKSTNLIQLIALPALATANFLDLFIVAEQNMVDVTITGKKDPSEAMQTMDQSTTGFDTNTQCLLDDNTWSRFGCQERTMYRQVGEFNFPRATIDPRPFVIATFPNPNDLQATKQICNITVTGEGTYTWDITSGFLGQSSDEVVKIDCGGQLTANEYEEQQTSGTQWEKKLWSQVDAAVQAAWAEDMGAESV